MGFSLCWLAVRGIPTEAVLERNGLRPTGAHGAYQERSLTYARLKGEWTLIVAHGCDHRIGTQGNLATVSTGCEAVACTLEEHDMLCTAEFWADGVRVWRLVHDAQKSIDHLAVDGRPPPNFEAIKERAGAEQALEVDEEDHVDHFFEVPLAVAQSLVGFKHDEANEVVESESQILEDASQAPVAKKWWQPWK